MKPLTRSLLTMAKYTRKHWDKTRCRGTRKDVADEMRAYLRHNPHANVRAAYARGAALYGYI